MYNRIIISTISAILLLDYLLKFVYFTAVESIKDIEAH